MNDKKDRAQKVIKLKSITIRNFKGITDLHIDFASENTLIAGNNGIGKTTVADAYMWLLFNKNTAGNTKFAVRPRDRERNELHDIISSVECAFTVGDFVFSAKKEQIEDMTKAERAELRPETIAKKKNYYFIDNAPYSESEFNSVIAQHLAPDSIFQLISNPLAFFAYDEKTQRKLLFEACGTVENETVEGWENVKALCGAVNTPERTRDSLSTRMTELRKRAERLPERIDELSKLLDLSIDYSEQITKARGEYSRIATAIKVKTDELTALIAVKPVVIVTTPPEKPVMPSEIDVQNAMRTYESLFEIEKTTAKRIEQIKSYEKFTECPKCGFDRISISDNTALIDTETNALNKTRAEKDRAFESWQVAESNYYDALSKYNAELSRYKSELVEYDAKMSNALKVDTIAIDKVRAELSELENQKTECATNGQTLKQKLEIVAQIEELRKERTFIDGEMATALESLDVVKDFINRKAAAEMEKINSRFKTVSFTLFEMQTNGEYRECCKAVMNGVTFADTNFAKKVQAGIEVSALFAKHYAVSAPIFIDSLESVQKLPATNSQFIGLQVMERDSGKFYIGEFPQSYFN